MRTSLWGSRSSWIKLPFTTSASIFLGQLAIFILLSCLTIQAGSKGTAKTWGDNAYGQLGDGSTTASLVPVDVTNLTDVIALSSGAGHNLVLKSDGIVWGWGYNVVGQLGNGNNQNSLVPVQTMNPGQVIALAAGPYHSLLVQSDGTVTACGYNDGGQLGDGTTANSLRPLAVAGLTDVTTVAGGRVHSVALKKDGTVWCWGSNSSGQLGVSYLSKSASPVQVIGLDGIVAIAAGWYHTLALKSDGTVWSWGYNSSGQLGNGGTTKGTVPARIEGLGGIAAIAAGGYHSLALKSDGTVSTWGDNYFGQVGENLPQKVTSPVSVSSLKDVKSIAAGTYHSLALTAKEGLFCWGSNSYGQLGNEDLANSPTPLAVQNLNNIVSIAGGANHSAVLVSASVTDATPPTTTATLSPQAQPSGWNNTNVLVSLEANDNDGGSGVKEIAYFITGAQNLATIVVSGSKTQFVIGNEGQSIVHFYATDNAGNVENEKNLLVAIDMTPPTVTFSGNKGVYMLDQTISITCVAADSLSGIASSTCQDIKGPAIGFALGSNTFSATATDKAGNIGNSSTSFTVKASFDSLSTLTRQIVTQDGIAKSLCAKLDAAKAADARGNVLARAGSLVAYINEVQAQTGKALTPQQAALLIRVAGAL